MLFKTLFFILTSTLLLFGGKEILIDLSLQKLYAKDNGKIYLSTPISSGRITHPTPRGSFTAFGKVKDNHSTLYPKRSSGKNGGAPMPYTIRVTHDGVAIHQGELPLDAQGNYYPDSHGCIRVPKNVAKKLFQWTPIGIPIKIKGKAKYVDKLNSLRKEYASIERGEDSEFSDRENVVINRYHDEFSEWGESYYSEGFTALVYTEGDLEYLDSL